MKRQDFYQQLVRRYIENKASDREKEVFFHLLSTGKLDNYLHTEMDVRARQLLNQAPPNQPRSIRPFVRYAVAASLAGLLLLAGILWVQFHRHNPDNNKNITSTYFKNEIHPGGSHAILTLADGSHIVLDSTSKGGLGLQGAARLTKLDSGSLSYKAISRDASPSYYNTISTPAGGQYQVTLADGTKVWLNALSTIKFPVSFNGLASRTVELTGEAYFEVSKDKNKAFHVKASGTDVEVLGTHFNVNAYADETALRTTLLEGSVKLNNSSDALILAPGEQGQTLPAGKFALVPNADMDEAVAWKNGYFTFDDADIQAVMRQLARWYGIRVKYEGSPTKALFWGKMGRDLNLTQVLSGLDKSKVHFQLEGTTLTVLP